MTTTEKRSTLQLVIGLFTMAIVQIVQHYYDLPDLLYGFCFGLGIAFGIIGMVNLVKNRKQSSDVSK